MFGKKVREKQENERRLRTLHGREVKYVSRRDSLSYGETIIGKDGYINIKEDELIIICDGNVIFRHPLEGLKGAELLSLEGINLRYSEGEDLLSYTVVAYYKYHR